MDIFELGNWIDEKNVLFKIHHLRLHVNLIWIRSKHGMPMWCLTGEPKPQTLYFCEANNEKELPYFQ
jgi:hypothetical protein